MNYELNKLIDFGEKHFEFFEEKYRMFIAKPEDIIGKKVVSIRGGFSKPSGGQVMLATEISTKHGRIDIILMPCEESQIAASERGKHLGWQLEYDKRVESIIFFE